MVKDLTCSNNDHPSQTFVVLEACGSSQYFADCVLHVSSGGAMTAAVRTFWLQF